MASASNDLLKTAVQHHRIGCLAEAEQIYREILNRDPNNSDALQLLGTLADQCGQHEQAIELIGRAIECSSRPLAGWHNNLGEAHRKLRQFDEAEVCYRKALELEPSHAGAHNNLGLVMLNLGRPAEAVSCFNSALRVQPNSAEARRNLATAAHQSGDVQAAIGHLRQAIQAKPQYVKAHHALGLLLHETGQLDEASESLRHAVRIKPDFAEAHHALSMVLHESGRTAEAVSSLERVLQIQPDNAEAHNDLANLLRDQRQLSKAIAHHQQAVRLQPNSAGGHANLARALQQNGQLADAVVEFRRAHKIDPSSLSALGALVHALQHQCAWDDLAELTRRLIGMVDRIDEFPDSQCCAPFGFLTLSEPTSAAQQLACTQSWAEQRLAVDPQSRHEHHPPRILDADQRITLGYLSADFHQHATADLTAEMFELHDRAQFAVHAYCYGHDDGSPMRQRLLGAFDRFVDLSGLSHHESANRIAADGVDILIDLKGYTEHARPQIPALRPAPIQVNYLGYPGTMGVPFIDYILVDEVIVPTSQQPDFSERLVHLPGCYQVNDSRRDVADTVPSRTECGLPEDGFVFCCFNNNYKITPTVFDIWMRILRSVSGSVLWLLEAHGIAAENLRREAAARNLSPDRLIFAPRVPPPQHRARYQHADLFVDTFPVNAHTTASEALASACPLVTIAGDTFISRVAASLLQANGLSELICTSKSDYESRILDLARNPAHLADVRDRLATQRAASGVFDGGRFVQHLEQAYLTMWDIYASGQSPQLFTVSHAE